MRSTTYLRRSGLVGVVTATATFVGLGPVGADSAPTTPVPIAPTSAPALAVPLSVQGNRIVDARGATVVLRGLQRDGTQGGPGTSPTPVSSTELGWMGYQQASSWHATVVRVPLGSAQWTGACPSLAKDPTAYRTAVDSEVQSLTSKGIVALIDLHTSTAGCTSIARHAMPDGPVSQQFWSDVATRYRDNLLVAFELYNEPHYVTDDIWLNGGSVQDCDITSTSRGTTAQRAQAQTLLAACQASAVKYTAVGMQQLYDIVTTRAPQHLVVVDGVGWASTPSAKPLNGWGGNLVYGLHPYTCPTPGAACQTTAKAVANLQLLDNWLGVASTAPVLVTEMGWPAYKPDGTYVDGSGYYRQTLAFLQQQSPQWGFVAFAFDGTAYGAFTLVTDTTGYAPNSTGQPVYDLLRGT
jgi:hypothetical protein